MPTRRQAFLPGSTHTRLKGRSEKAFELRKKLVDKIKARPYNNRARGINSVVECHLAKVKVASPNLVSRSTDIKVVSSRQPFLLPLQIFPSRINESGVKPRACLFRTCFRVFGYEIGILTPEILFLHLKPLFQVRNRYLLPNSLCQM